MTRHGLFRRSATRMRGGVPLALLGWLSTGALGLFVLALHRLEAQQPASTLALDEVASIAFGSALLGMLITLATVRWGAARRRHSREAMLRAQSSEVAAREARDQVLRELHDGLGGHLASALSLTEQAVADQAPPDALRRLHQALDDSLAELRLSIDLLAQRDHVVAQALGEMRQRVEPALRAAGRELRWDLQADTDGVRLAAAETVHLLRLVREGFCASLLAARAATRVQLRLARVDTETGERLVLGMIDDGRDVEALDAAGAAQLARRVADMQRRATALGAQAVIGAHDEGWGFELVLPLPR